MIPECLSISLGRTVPSCFSDSIYATCIASNTQGTPFPLRIEIRLAGVRGGRTYTRLNREPNWVSVKKFSRGIHRRNHAHSCNRISERADRCHSWLHHIRSAIEIANPHRERYYVAKSWLPTIKNEEKRQTKIQSG